jgi:Tfp pilus assembly protein PilF
MRRTRSTIATARVSHVELVIPAALLALPIIALAGCGDSRTETSTAQPTPAVSEPVVVAKSEPTEPVIPDTVTYEQAESVYNERRYADAARMFEVYTRNRPDNPWGHYMLGLSSWKAGDFTVAEAAFLAALERDPSHVKSMLNLARVLLDVSRPREALERVTVALETDPESADAHRLMGRVRTTLGQHEEALESYRQALSIDEEDVWSMNNMGLLFIQTGRYEDALRPLARAVQLRDDVAIFHNNLGIALERTGHFSKASESYRAALAVDSTYEKAKVSLARVDQRLESSTTPAIDLGALGDSFSADVRRWKEERVVASTPVQQP